MFDEMLSVLNHEIKISEVLESINKYKIIFGILKEDGSTLVEVNILNLDESITKKTLPLSEVMFFIDKGTLTIPATFILEKISYYADTQLEMTIDELIEKSNNSILTEGDVENSLQILVVKINNFAKGIGQNIKEDQSRLSTILGKKDEGKYLIDLNILSKYLKCKLIKV